MNYSNQQLGSLSSVIIFFFFYFRYRLIPGDECDLTNGFKPDNGIISLDEVCNLGDDKKFIVDELKQPIKVCDHPTKC